LAGGLQPDVGRFLDGEPENMINISVKKVRPVVPVYVNMSAPYFITAETIANRGAAIVALVEQLEEEADVELHLYTCMTTSRKKNLAVEIVPMLSPLDFDFLSLAFTDERFLRNAVCCLYEAWYRAKDPSEIETGDGCPMDYGQDILASQVDILEPIHFTALGKHNEKLFENAHKSAETIAAIIERYNKSQNQNAE